jgi:uncharacterized protein Usg
MADLHKQVFQNYSLTTAEILYHLPDYPDLLQSFIWQEYDLAPRYPVLNKFLHFWSHNLDGRLHSVYVAHQRLITPGEMSFTDCEFSLH